MSEASSTALRLAAVPISERSIGWQADATAELRRLHGVEFALRNCEVALTKMAKKYMDAADQRDELLAALRYHQDQTRPIQRSIDAIAKATGGAA